METQSKKISSCRCHLTRFFTLKGEGVISGLGKAVSRSSGTNFSGTGVNLPRFPHIGVAGITPKRRKDGQQ